MKAYQMRKIVKKSQHWHKHGKHSHMHEIVMLERRRPAYSRRALQGWCGCVRDLLK